MISPQVASSSSAITLAGKNPAVDSGQRILLPKNVRLILATHNRKKVDELRVILTEAIPDLGAGAVSCAADIEIAEPVEDGISFAANALLKARAVSQATGLIAVADDSGLVVEVMGAAPGILSARWCGKHGDDSANNALLLAQLTGFKQCDRGAKFVCAAACVSPSGAEFVVEGELSGRMLSAPVGDGGFGYDPIFQPDGYSGSLAQLSALEKNAISHRGQAFRKLVPHLVQEITNQDAN